ncbi:hypothetical protein DEA98_14620 [Brucella pseudogrignonensis]|nr:hypothetical protein [Brucella pseudogrignonensis]
MGQGDLAEHFAAVGFPLARCQGQGCKDALGVDRSEARKGKGLLETANAGQVRNFILAWIASNPHLSADIIRGYCEDHFGSFLVDRHGVMTPLPPLRTFQHFISALKADEKLVLTKITDPDKFRSTMKLSGTGTYRHVDEPNALWMIDASPVDALCVDGRHSMYACIDIATRRLVITLSKTPRASAVALLIRKSTLKWGVATIIKTDNGSDFVAVATKRLFDNLDITPDVSDAYTPEQKATSSASSRHFSTRYAHSCRDISATQLLIVRQSKVGRALRNVSVPTKRSCLRSILQRRNFSSTLMTG